MWGCILYFERRQKNKIIQKEFLARAVVSFIRICTHTAWHSVPRVILYVSFKRELYCFLSSGSRTRSITKPPAMRWRCFDPLMGTSHRTLFTGHLKSNSCSCVKRHTASSLPAQAPPVAPLRADLDSWKKWSLLAKKPTWKWCKKGVPTKIWAHDSPKA